MVAQRGQLSRELADVVCLCWRFDLIQHNTSRSQADRQCDYI